VNLNSWDYYDLETEMAGATLGKLQELFKREDKKYSDKCGEFFQNMSKLTEEGQAKLLKECEHFEGARLKVALAIAEALTK
jgi:hypothetical protein